MGKQKPPSQPTSSDSKLLLQIAKLEADLKKARKENEKKEKRVVRDEGKIPRPDGRVGRAGGYKLIEAMGLEENRAKYSRLLGSVRDIATKNLNMNLTISKQPKMGVTAVVVLAQEENRFFCQFTDGWPVYDMLKQCLQNKASYVRKKGNDGSDSEQEEAEKSGIEEAVGSANEDDHDDVPLKKAKTTVGKKPQKIKEKKKTKAKAKKTIKKDVQQKTSSSKGKNKVQEKDESPGLTSPPTQPRPQPVPRYGNNATAGPSGQLEHDIESKHTVLNKIDIIGQPCPYCESADDTVPNNPSDQLLRLFQARQLLLDSGIDDGRLERALAEICGQITLECTTQSMLTLGRFRGWPRLIDFAAIPERVSQMEDELCNVIQDKDFRHKTLVWDQLKGIEGMDIDKLPMSRRFQYMAMNPSRPGYYGPKGSLVIQSSLLRLFPADEDLSEYISPWSTQSFTNLILTPFVVIKLIAEDLDSTPETAWEEMVASGSYGVQVNPGEDGDVDLEAILKKNVKGFVADRKKVTEKSGVLEIKKEPVSGRLLPPSLKRKANNENYEEITLGSVPFLPPPGKKIKPTETKGPLTIKLNIPARKTKNSQKE